MENKINFNGYFLTRYENKALKYIYKNGKIDKNDISKNMQKTLLDYNLIEFNTQNNLRKSDGSPIYDGTISTTDLYIRYRKYLRTTFFERKLPVIISLLALLIAILSAYFTYLQVK